MNDSSIIETAARALNHEGWTCFKGADEPGHYDECEDCKRVCDDVARAVLAAIHPTVSTVDELDALPQWSAIIDHEGDVGQRLGEWWHFPESAPMRSSRVIKYGPATVLHIPGGAA